MGFCEDLGWFLGWVVLTVLERVSGLGGVPGEAGSDPDVPGALVFLVFFSFYIYIWV